MVSIKSPTDLLTSYRQHSPYTRTETSAEAGDTGQENSAPLKDQSASYILDISPAARRFLHSRKDAPEMGKPPPPPPPPSGAGGTGSLSDEELLEAIESARRKVRPLIGEGMVDEVVDEEGNIDQARLKEIIQVQQETRQAAFRTDQPFFS